MLKCIYKNIKSGKLYCFEGEEGKKPEIFTVYCDKYDTEGEYKIDKNGKPYKVFDVEKVKTKKGFDVFRAVKKKDGE